MSVKHIVVLSLIAIGASVPCISVASQAETHVQAEQDGPDLVFSEIQPFWEGAPSNVWVEVQNVGNRDATIAGWRVRDAEGVTFQFPDAASAVRPGGMVIVFFGDERQAPPVGERRGTWYLAPPIVDGKRFLKEGARSCALVRSAEAGGGDSDIVEWQQPCTVSEIVRRLKAAVESGDEQERKRVLNLIGGVQRRLDVGGTLAREEIDKHRRDAEWFPYSSCEVSQGEPNPPFHMPYYMFGTPQVVDDEAPDTQKFTWAKYERPVRFQVARDSEFRDVVFDTMAGPIGTLMPFKENRLSSGTYYWRLRGEVRDADGSVRCSKWAPCCPRSFLVEP